MADVYNLTLKVDADTSGVKQFTTEVDKATASTDNWTEAKQRLADADKGYQAVASRTGETVDQVRRRFEGLATATELASNKNINHYNSIQENRDAYARFNSVAQQSTALQTGIGNVVSTVASRQKAAAAAIAENTKNMQQQRQEMTLTIRALENLAYAFGLPLRAMGRLNMGFGGHGGGGGGGGGAGGVASAAAQIAKVTKTDEEAAAAAAGGGGLPPIGGVGGVAASTLVVAGLTAVAFATKKVIDMMDAYQRKEADIANTARHLSDELAHQEDQWVATAQAATNFSDIAKLGMTQATAVAAAHSKALDTQMSANLGPGIWTQTFETIQDFISKTFGAKETFAPWSDQLKEAARDAKQYADNLALASIATSRLAEDTANFRAHIAQLPLNQQLQTLTSNVSVLPEQQGLTQLQQQKTDLYSKQDTMSVTDFATALAKLNERIAEQQKLIDAVKGKIDSYAKAMDNVNDQIAVNNLAGSENAQKLKEIDIQAKATFDTINNAGGKTAESYAAATKASNDFKASLLKKKDVEDQKIILSSIGGDLKVIIDYWDEYTKIQLYSTDADSRHYHELQNIQGAIKNLGNPIRDVEKLIASGAISPRDADLARWEAYHETADRAMTLTEDRMKANQATMGDVVETGLARLNESWGSWETQASKLVQDIGNALSNDIAGGLTDILDGTKSLTQGFHDMAVAIIKDIEGMIIKMLIQLAIQTAINAITGGSGFGSLGGIFSGSAPAYGYGSNVKQAGGPIGGTGSGDHVPILAEPGEFMIRKSAAQKIGYSRLNEWNKMAGGGTVGYPDLTDAGLHPTTYGPGSPNPTNADLKEFTGIHGISLQPNDVALPSSIAREYGLRAGDSFLYNGHVYRYADNPSGRVGRVIDFYYAARGGGPRRSTSTTGRRGGLQPGWINNTFTLPTHAGDDRRLINDSSFQYSGPSYPWRSGGPDMSDWGGTFNFDPSTGSWIRGGLETDVRPIGIQGVTPSGTGNNPVASDYIGSTPFGTSSNQPTGFNAHGNPVWGGQAPGFNIPGGINWSPGSPGGNLSGTFGNIYGNTILRHALKFGMFPQDAFGRPAGTWTNAIRRNILAHGLPNPNYASQLRSTTTGGLRGGQLPMAHAFHMGGIVDAWSAMASGGVVEAGEGVFTQKQMKSLAPAGGGVSVDNSSVGVNVVVNNNQASTSVSGSGAGGMSEHDARELGRLVVGVVQAQIEKQKRSGGSLYVSRSARGG